MEYAISPILFALVLVSKLIHCLLGYRLAQVMLEVVIVHYTGDLLVFFGKLLR
jgi:hypothetical protein